MPGETMNDEQRLAKRIAKKFGLNVRTQRDNAAIAPESMWIVCNGKRGSAFGAFYVDGEHPLLGTDRYWGLVDRQWQTGDTESSPSPKIPSCLRRGMSVEEAELALAAEGF